LEVLDATRSKDWVKASAGIDGLRTEYDQHRWREPPKRLDALMTGALDQLAKAVMAHDLRAAPLAALEVAGVAADLTLRYRSPAEVDLMRFDLWTRTLVVDADARDARAVAGDVATLGWLRDRIALDDTDANRIDDQLRYLAAAADAEDTWSAANAADRLRKTIAGIAPK
jgi:hypothetical protein